MTMKVMIKKMEMVAWLMITTHWALSMCQAFHTALFLNLILNNLFYRWRNGNSEKLSNTPRKTKLMSLKQSILTHLMPSVHCFFLYVSLCKRRTELSEVCSLLVCELSEDWQLRDYDGKSKAIGFTHTKVGNTDCHCVILGKWLNPFGSRFFTCKNGQNIHTLVALMERWSEMASV